MTDMNQRGLRGALDSQIDEGLQKWLRRLRVKEKLSAETIAWMIRDEFQVEVSARTVARWCDTFKIGTPYPKSKAS